MKIDMEKRSLLTSKAADKSILNEEKKRARLLKRTFVLAALAGAMTFGAQAQAADVYTVTDGTSDDYTYKLTDGTTTQYKKVNINTEGMTTSGHIDWTKSDEEGTSSYTWKSDAIPLASNIKTDPESGTTLTSANGAVRFNLPHNNATETQYYI